MKLYEMSFFHYQMTTNSTVVQLLLLIICTFVKSWNEKFLFMLNKVFELKQEGNKN